MSGVTKAVLSGSTTGKQIKVVATGTAGTLVHTATAGTVSYDEIWLWANGGTNTAPVLLTIEWGGVAAPDDNLTVTVLPNIGDQLIIAGKVLQNGLVVRAFAASANVVTVSGYVNVITN